MPRTSGIRSDPKLKRVAVGAAAWRSACDILLSGRMAFLARAALEYSTASPVSTSAAGPLWLADTRTRKPAPQLDGAQLSSADRMAATQVSRGISPLDMCNARTGRFFFRVTRKTWASGLPTHPVLAFLTCSSLRRVCSAYTATLYLAHGLRTCYSSIPFSHSGGCTRQLLRFPLQRAGLWSGPSSFSNLLSTAQVKHLPSGRPSTLAARYPVQLLRTVRASVAYEPEVSEHGASAPVAASPVATTTAERTRQRCRAPEQRH